MMRGIRIRFLFMGIFRRLRCKKCEYVKETEEILPPYTAFVFSQLGFNFIVVVWYGDIGRGEDEKDSICSNWVSAQPHL